MHGLTVSHSALQTPVLTSGVLLLDDDPGVGRLFSRILRRAGCKVDCVETAERFEAVYRATRPTFLIIDVILGGKDCCPVLDFLGEQRSKVPIILTSGYDHRILSLAERTAKRNGLVVAGILEKRHDPDRIIDLVRRHLVTSC